ncbi:MAG TPA: hypothetical protein VJ740_14330 [Hyphomicrobiaceae bacterium]|nr:hypothetical protein [Hyphomicrobiaceae bacterium]
MGDTMSMVELLSPLRKIAGAGSPRAMLGGPSLRARLAIWARTCAAYYGAVALYEDLNRLSDAELARRGLTRANLARDIIAARDPAPRRRTG